MRICFSECLREGVWSLGTKCHTMYVRETSQFDQYNTRTGKTFGAVACMSFFKCFFQKHAYFMTSFYMYNKPVHEISNNVVCATSKGSDQPAHTRSLIKAFASRLSIL